MSTPPSYWSSPWPGEDGGPTRTSFARVAGPRFEPGEVDVQFRSAIATTMVVLRDPGEVFSLHHHPGPESIAWVERIDPLTLEPVARSRDLDGGPVWPGGMAAHENGSLYVVFGNHAHRLDANCEVIASRALPRIRPYNSFVILPDGHLVTKDFGGVLPGNDSAAHTYEPAELLVLEPERLEIVARVALPEASIARVSADESTVYVVGVARLWRVAWNGTTARLDTAFDAPYITAGQTYGWDPVIALNAAWFLDNGFGSERYVGTFRGRGVNASPLHLVRIDLDKGAASLTEICGEPNGVVANPPLVDEARRIAVGFDSGNGVVAAFDIAPDGMTAPRWTRAQNHASHLLLYPDTGELVATDHDADRMMDQLVVLDIATGDERLRVDTGSPLQSVLFPAPGWDRDLYYCSFAGIAHVTATERP